MSNNTLGAIIAGGRSMRYGSPKQLAEVGGVRLIDRVAHVLGQCAADVVVITNDGALAAAMARPWRPDVLTGVGSLAGVHAALLWARERGCSGVLAVAADMPLLSAPLLCRLCDLGAEGFDVVLPESPGPRGLEPLCAWYGPACIAAIEATVARGDARMIGFHDAVRVHRLPLVEVRSFGDPERLFMNINTPADHAQVEQWLAQESV